MFANLSGYLTGMLYGFPGLRLTSGDPETWAEREVRLPAGWNSIAAERLWVRGTPHQLEARAGGRARLTPL
jgi:hypothetical protein